MNRIFKIIGNGNLNIKKVLSVVVLGSGLVFASPVLAVGKVPDDEIKANLCSEAFCQSRWTDVTLLVCSQGPIQPKTNESQVFGSYIEGSSGLCYCPCNFSRFYSAPQIN